MCEIINRKAAIAGKAYYRKENLPEGSAYWFDVMAAPCACGKTHWVRPKEMLGWVEAVVEDPIE